MSSTPRPEPARRAYQRSTTGLVGAILACLGLILVVFVLTLFQKRHTADPAGTIDYTAQLAQARRDASFHVVAPVRSPKGLRPTSVDWRSTAPAHWHLGFVTTSGDYVGLEQGTGTATSFIADSTAATIPGPTVTIGGEHWQTLSSKHEVEHAYFHTDRGVTTLVTGTATTSQLTAFIRSLR